MDFNSLLTIFNYVAVAYGLMCIARTCGLHNPWLSWIPFARDYQLGAVADHYAANYQQRTTRSRITLLVLSIILSGTGVAAAVLILTSVFTLLNQAGLDLFELSADPMLLATRLEDFFMSMNEQELMQMAYSLLGSILIPLLILLVVAIVYLVFYCSALYRVYKLVDPERAVLYLALSIIFSNVAPGIIFLFLANKMKAPPTQPTPPPFEESSSGPYSV